jgi:hypothetical protein
MEVSKFKVGQVWDTMKGVIIITAIDNKHMKFTWLSVKKDINSYLLKIDGGCDEAGLGYISANNGKYIPAYNTPLYKAINGLD